MGCFNSMVDKVDRIMALIVPGINNPFEHFWRGPLGKLCNEMIEIDLKDYYEKQGSVKALKSILELFKHKQPDYLFIYDRLYYDLNIPELLTELRKISPKTKSVFISGDDDLMFESTKYLARYFDYVFVGQLQCIKDFEKEGVKNVLPVVIISSVQPTKINYKKNYPITFMGGPNENRIKMIEALCKNGFDIKVFGIREWGKFPIIKNIYGGFLSSMEYIKTLYQTKINLCFSKNAIGVHHIKGRFFENSAYKTFSLVEYCPILATLFKENEEIVFFRSRKELFEKIEYYLEHEKEREKIAEAAYKKIKKNFNLEKDLSNFIIRTKDNISHLDMPKYDYRVLNLEEKHMRLSKKELFQIIKSYEYISFSRSKTIHSKLKNNLQIYSLKLTGKEVSCCDYFIYSRILGNYSYFRFSPGIKYLDADYSKFLNINQFFMTKKFFVNNFEKIRKDYFSERITFSNKKNTVLVPVPLVKIVSFRKGFFGKEFDKNSEMFFTYYFPRVLYSLRKHPVKFMVFVYGLFLEAVSGKRFIFAQLRKKYLDHIKIFR